VKRVFFLAAVLCQTLTVAAQAQDADPLLELQRIEELERRTNELGTLQQRGGVPDPGPPQAATGPCFPIQQLTVEGVTILAPDEVAAITGKYVPKCMQGADIQAVMRELDATYAERGFITAKTYIPPQNLLEGSLLLSVVEGKVEDLFLLDATGEVDTPRGRSQLYTAFGNPVGQAFQLREFEQGLDQMNRLKSVEAIMQLQPGAEVGGSYVLVQRLQEDRFRGYFRLDNMGSESTGQNTFAIDAEVDDLFGANDTWTLGLSGSQNTNALSVSGSMPFGYLTLGMNIGYSEYLTPLSSFSEVFGTTETAGLTVDYLIARDQLTTTTLSFGASTRRADRFINFTQLTPQNLTTVDFGVRHLRLSEAARNSYDATLTFGLRALGADRPSDVDGAPDPQFAKISLGWQRQGALGTVGTLVQDLRVQYSPDMLYGAEQMSLGSFSTVRGYENSVAVGDSGAVLRTDLYLDPAWWTAPFSDETAAKLAGSTQMHVFFDTGIVWDEARHTREGAAGVGVGVIWSRAPFNVTGIVAVPLLEGEDLRVGDPVLQVRLDVKGW
jgi:hemolysin activation/secretion protein